MKYLTEQHNFTHYSARALITEAVKDRGLEPSRKNFRLTANDLRRQHGNDFIVKETFKKIIAEGAMNAVLESIRTTAETETLKKEGGILIAVDADQALRYRRIKKRQSESDHISLAEFKQQEELEMNDPDPNGMQKAAVMAAADHTIINDSTLATLHKKIEQMLNQLT